MLRPPVRIVAASDRDLVADLLHLCAQLVKAVFSVIADARLVVVKKVFLPYCHRRQVRHDHIASGQNALLPPACVQRAERGRRRKQRVRQQQPHQAQKVERQLGASMGEIAKRRILVRKKRTHADHLGAKVCQKFHVLRQRLAV